MADVDKDWINKQLGKAISAEESVLKSERDHRNNAKSAELRNVYDRLIQDDEKHLNDMKKIGEKYGFTGGGVMESAGGIVGGLKSAAESVAMADPFQSMGDDLALKSQAVNIDHVWYGIFSSIGDHESARMLEEAAKEDEEHEQLMRESLTNVGIKEAHGEEVSDI